MRSQWNHRGTTRDLAACDDAHLATATRHPAGATARTSDAAALRRGPSGHAHLSDTPGATLSAETHQRIQDGDVWRRGQCRSADSSSSSILAGSCAR